MRRFARYVVMVIGDNIELLGSRIQKFGGDVFVRGWNMGQPPKVKK